MRSHVETTLAAILLLAGSAGASRSGEFDSVRFDEVRELIHLRMRDENVPSIVVGVVHGNKQLWAEGFGWADQEEQIPATIHTPYRIGSTTKPLTATTVMTLVERGDLELDRHINEYLGEAKIEARLPKLSKATLSTVLQHSSGLPGHWETYFADETDRPQPIDVLVHRYGKLMIRPGRWFNYSNLGYEILADVAERKTGKEFASLLRDEVCLPLGMTRTFLGVDNVTTDQRAVGYRASGERVPDAWTSVPAAGDAYSTVHDLLRFGQFHMKLHADDQEQILADATIDMMQQRTIPMGREAYGLGWHIRDDLNGRRHVLHGGAHVGWECHFDMIPQEELCVVVMANKDTKWPGYRLCLEVTDAIYAALFNCQVKDVQLEGGYDLGLPSEEPPGVPGKLTGKWTGIVETYKKDVPIVVWFKENGDVEAKLDEQDVMPVKDASFRGDVFRGQMKADIGTENANRRNYYLDWELTFRKGELSGILHARGEDPFGPKPGRGLHLAHWARIRPANHDLPPQN